MLGLLGAWTARSLALAGSLGALLVLARLRNPFLRKNLWTLVLAVILVLPLLMRLPGLPIHTSLGAVIVRGAAARVLGGTSDSLGLDSLYAGVAGVLLSRYAISLARTTLLRARARRIAAPWAAGLDIRAAAALAGPATFGRTILLPDPLPAWSEQERAAILAHERAHVLGRDCYRLWLAQLYKCVCWFNPLAWWLAHHLLALAEATSDAAAVASIGDGRRYAQLLLDCGARGLNSRPAALLSAPASRARSALGLRIERILGARAPEQPPRRSTLLFAAAALVPFVLLSALARPQPGLRSPATARAASGPHRQSALAVANFRPAGRTMRTRYPSKALHAGVNGWAYVRVTVDPNGRATRVQLIRVSPRHYGFAAAALRVARTIHYRNETHRTLVSTLPVKFALSPPPASHRTT
jgi:TonB family protein